MVTLVSFNEILTISSQSAKDFSDNVLNEEGSESRINPLPENTLMPNLVAFGGKIMLFKRRHPTNILEGIFWISVKERSTLTRCGVSNRQYE